MGDPGGKYGVQASPLKHFPVASSPKSFSRMTYFVSSGSLNLNLINQSINQSTNPPGFKHFNAFSVLL